jgi:ABC-type transport system involved in multi-copper enzyme maturation permease subunit
MLNLFALENPALTRELRTRLRGSRAFVLLFAYLFVLAITLFIAYSSWATMQNANSGMAFQIGRRFFATLFIVQALLVAIITPSLTAGGLTIEREQRTLDMLKISLLSRFQIVWGKLIAALGYIALLIVASLPLFSLSFLLGGVAPDEIIICCALLLTTAFVYGAVGLGCSSIFKTTTYATLATYAVLTVMFFTTLPFTFSGMASAFGGIGGRASGMGLAALNPMGAMSSPGTMDSYFGITLPIWLTGGGMNLFLGTIFTIAAAHRIDYPRSDRSGLLRLLTAVYLAFLSLGSYHFITVGLRMLGGGTNDWAIVCGYVSALALPVLIPLFVSSDGLPRTGGVWSLFNPGRLSCGEGPSGLLYVLLLIVMTMTIFFLVLRYDARLPQASLTQIGQLTGLLLATAWGFGGLALFVSVVTRNRNISMIVTFLVMTVLYMIPLSLASWFTDSAPNAAKSAISGLSPLSAVTAIFNTTPIRDTAPVIICISLYLISGMIFLWLASRHDRSLAAQNTLSA